MRSKLMWMILGLMALGGCRYGRAAPYECESAECGSAPEMEAATDAGTR